MTPAELPAYLAQIRARVEASAIPVVDAIAETYEEHLVGFTLHESGSHPPVTRTPAAPGRPPAFMPGGVNGSLSGSVVRTPGAGGGGVAEAAVMPTTIYAATLQWGGDHVGRPMMWLWVKYVGPAAVRARGWIKHETHHPAYPYMDVAVGETVASGSLVRSAAARFMAVVWGR